MKSYSLITALAVLLIITLIAPSAFPIVPQKAYAQGVPTNEMPTSYITLQDTISAIRNTITSIATVAQQVNTYVLQPLAFVLSGQLLKYITSGAIAFVLGKSNGTGKAQFVVNLRGTMQTVGDVQALAFFSRLRSLNSPFAASITSSLTTNYLQNTSLAGFFAANQCTLARSSPNINSFLAGNWSQGGVKAWFALTTQNQNNPYMLYQASQAELSSVVSGVQSARMAELNWGQGYLSWCGNGANASSGDPCTNKDGSSGTIQTPGSVIKAALDKALGTDQDKLVQMGSVASEINGILGNIGTVMNTAGLAFSIGGGSSGTSGGLLGMMNTSGANRNSLFSQYQTPGYLGVTQSTVAQNASTLPISGSQMLNSISQYQSSWNTINAAANTASTSIAALASYCTTKADAARDLLRGTYAGNTTAESILTPFISASIAQASTTQTVFTNKIAPVFAQVAASSVIIATANAMVQRIQNEQNSTTDEGGTAYTDDMRTLQTMPPTTSDIAMVQIEAQTSGGAIASPTGSLAVSGGTTVDRMNLISANANSLKSSCDLPPDSVLNPPQETYNNGW